MSDALRPVRDVQQGVLVAWLSGRSVNSAIQPSASPTQKIICSDRKAAPGEELALNFIQLKP